MEKLLTDDLIVQIRQVFEKLKNPVQIFLFTSPDKEDACNPTRQLLEELAPLSGLLSLSVYDIHAENKLAGLYKVEGKAPAIVIAAKEAGQVADFGIRLLGVPSGHEFSTLIQDLLLVSARDSGLSDQLRAYLRGLNKPLVLQVFTTPT